MAHRAVATDAATKDRALRIAAEHGAAKASRQTGIPAGTPRAQEQRARHSGLEPSRPDAGAARPTRRPARADRRGLGNVTGRGDSASLSQLTLSNRPPAWPATSRSDRRLRPALGTCGLPLGHMSGGRLGGCCSGLSVCSISHRPLGYAESNRSSA
jgi:hypothetical protein